MTVTELHPAKRRHVATRKLATIESMDKRGRHVKPFMELIERIERDLGPDLSAIDRELVTTFASAAVVVRMLAAKIAKEEQVDLSALSAVGGLLVKIAAKLNSQVATKRRASAEAEAAVDPLAYAREHAEGGEEDVA